MARRNLILLAGAALALLGLAGWWLLAGGAPASRFLGQVEPNAHPAAPAPAAPGFPWDFSAAGTARAYQLRGEFVLAVESNFQPQAIPAQTQSLAGRLRLESRGAGRAALSLADRQASVNGRPLNLPAGGPEVLTDRLPESGVIDLGPGEVQLILRLLLPVPPAGSGPGAENEFIVSLPSQPGTESVPPLTARQRLTGYVTAGGRTCARLETVIDERGTLSPSGLTGRVDYSARGRAVAFFDPAARALVSGRVALRVRIRMFVDLEVMPGLPAPADMPDTMEMSADIDLLGILESAAD